MTLDPQLAKKRLIKMLVIDGVCMIVAVAACVGAFVLGEKWMLGLFALAIGAGLATQVWFIAGLRRTGRGV